MTVQDRKIESVTEKGTDGWPAGIRLWEKKKK